jgi:monoamine oxidase
VTRHGRSGPSYSPVTGFLRGLQAAQTQASAGGPPVDELIGQAAEHRLRRRELLAGGLGLAGAAVLGGCTGPAAEPQPSPTTPAPSADSTTGPAQPRVAIVGAGLAGLCCARALWSGRAVASTVYDADTTHVGGRCWTLRDFFTDGRIGEHGGAFINSDQKAIRRLVADLGLTLETVDGGDLPHGKDIFWLGGEPYTYAEAQADWAEIGYPVFRAARRSAPWPQRYDDHTRAGRRLDRMTVPEWLEDTGIGSRSRLGRLLMSDVVSEYGSDPQQQSAYNLVSLLGYNSRGSLDPLSGYDEKYHVAGGNDQIVSGVVAGLPAGTVQQGYELVALAQQGDGSYRLGFRRDGKAVDVVADVVVLALPFTALQRVDLSRAGLSRRKLRTVRSAVLGQNAKLHVELSHKTWPELGYAGSVYTDWDGFCVAWDDSVPLGPTGSPAVLLGYPGGRTGRHVLTGAAHGAAPQADVTWFLDQVEAVFPGTRAAYTGVAYEDHWSVDPWHHGAYTSMRPGQYTTTFGYAGVPEGGVHFAGEHTELDFGFLDSAVVSGERVAREIRAAL